MHWKRKAWDFKINFMFTKCPKKKWLCYLSLWPDPHLPLVLYLLSTLYRLLVIFLETHLIRSPLYKKLILLAAIALNTNSLQGNVKYFQFGLYFQTHLMPFSYTVYVLATRNSNNKSLSLHMMSSLPEMPTFLLVFTPSNTSTRFNRFTFCRSPFLIGGSPLCCIKDTIVAGIAAMGHKIAKYLQHGHVCSFCPVGCEQQFCEQFLDHILKRKFLELCFLFFSSDRLECGRSTLRNSRTARQIKAGLPVHCVEHSISTLSWLPIS